MNNIPQDFPMQFICASRTFSTPEAPVAAPFLRRSFTLGALPESALLRICGLGFYELYINGKNITKGPLAPYISAPDDILYYDDYNVLPHLQTGENVIGLWLGNGFQNNPGGNVWDFQKARGRGAPAVALWLSCMQNGEEAFFLQTDGQFRVHTSPVVYDDYRQGIHYDARLEQPGWNAPGFSAESWQPAMSAPIPRGDARICHAEPIIVEKEIRPVAIVEEEEGFRYDFGENNTGVCRLRFAGEAGRQVEMLHGEALENGKLFCANISFTQDPYKDLVQKDIYIANGMPASYIPPFTYHGFRYVLVKGITKEEATPDLLTFLVMHSDLAERGGFACSDSVANALQTITRRSTLSNFLYFPNDCPHREKNGWTGDASLSAEHTLLNLAPEASYREWLHNIRSAQREDGALPGIVPTTGWGFHWGNGPAWDNVLFNLPYFTYMYRGDGEIIKENAAAMLRYLHYVNGRRGEDGTVAIGLGDWCQVGHKNHEYDAPLRFTDTVLVYDMAKKAALMLKEAGMPLQAGFASAMEKDLYNTCRKHLINEETLCADGFCQTTQAMALYYGLFKEEERKPAFQLLLGLIEKAENHMDVGILGGRVIFHVLSAFGKSDLAYEMITRPDYPSYGNWVARGATTLWETFRPENDRIDSLNHHFWGDISGWFIREIAGIQYNPACNAVNSLTVAPSFIPQLSFAEGWHECPLGRIEAFWERLPGKPERVSLRVSIPKGMEASLVLEEGWRLAEEEKGLRLKTGSYLLQRC